jgi:hypothetical protein
MTKNIASNGYIYALPVCPDIWLPAKKTIPPHATSGGGIPFSLKEAGTSRSIETLEKDSIGKAKKPFILFQNVLCTEQSYEIDLFLSNAKTDIPDYIKNPGYIGRLFRFGMGILPPNSLGLESSQSTKGMKEGRQSSARGNMNRCQKRSVTRAVEVKGDCVSNVNNVGFRQVVRELETADTKERIVPEPEWKEWQGFEGKLIWMLM